MSKTKEVFTSREIAHVWAHQSQESGRCPANMRFEGTAFYSYGTCIANIITHKGRKAFIRDSHGFSISTSKHQSFVRGAIPDSEKTFTVNIGNRGQRLNLSAKELVEHYEYEFSTGLGNLENSTATEHKRKENFLHAVSFLEKAIECAEFFGLATAKLKKKRAKLEDEIRAALLFINDRTARLSNARARRDEKKRFERIAKAEARASSDLTGTDVSETNLTAMLEILPLDHHLRGRVQAEYDRRTACAKELWIGGGALLPVLSRGPVVLRAMHAPNDKDQRFDPIVETSLGARIPYADAERAFRFAIARRSKGWHRNGEQFAVGGYQLDAVNSGGIVAGCHRISWSEIGRFAMSQGWLE